MAMYQAAAGQKEGARKYLDWCLEHAACHDFLPEQSDKRTGEAASAVPLGWSHAWAIVLLHMLSDEPTGRSVIPAPGLVHARPAADRKPVSPAPTRR
jgi:hypothetical protein